ncbi:unnamed protein product [Soboliphyme baturini]|uniref:G_PROTEIN_RECEP_F1_2 domain-containing protein n=1 Tax=Soboliphyme baturini TaxID=241478 RepID=A0A183IPK7_9BILA|nr:unnamed protein product [Soboliphyme baturini]
MWQCRWSNATASLVMHQVLKRRERSGLPVQHLIAVSVAASVNTLMAIALERYFALCKPLYSRQWKTKSNTIRMIFGVWVLAFLFSIPHAIVAEKWPSKESHLIYFIFLLQVLFVIPLIVMTFLYSLVIRSFLVGIQLQTSAPSLRRKRRISRFPMIHRQRDETSFSQDSSDADRRVYDRPVKFESRWNGNMLRCTHAAQSLTNKKRVIKMLAAIVVEFFICWMPFYTYYLVIVIKPSNFNANFHTVFLIMAYLSSCTNPITYCFMNGKFRQAFLAAFGCICTRLKRKYVIYNPREKSTTIKRQETHMKSTTVVSSSNISRGIKNDKNGPD